MHLEIQNWEKGEYCDCKWFLPLVTKRCWSVSDLEQGQKTRAGSHSWVPLFPSGTQQPTILHNIAQYWKTHTTAQYYKTTQHCTIFQKTQQHNITTQHNIAQYCKTHTTTQYYNTAQHCTILQNTHNSTILNTTQHSTILQKNRTQYTTHWTILQKHNNNTNVYEHKTQNPVMSKHKIWTENSADSR